MTKIDDAVTLARLGGANIIHTKQVLAVYPSGNTKILQSISWPAKEDAFKVKKAVPKKTVLKKPVVNISEEVI